MRAKSGCEFSQGHGHGTQAFARRGEDRIADCRSQGDDSGFSGSRRGKVFAVDQHDFHLRRVAEARYAILGEGAIEDLSVSSVNGNLSQG